MSSCPASFAFSTPISSLWHSPRSFTSSSVPPKTIPCGTVTRNEESCIIATETPSPWADWRVTRQQVTSPAQMQLWNKKKKQKGTMQSSPTGATAGHTKRREGILHTCGDVGHTRNEGTKERSGANTASWSQAGDASLLALTASKWKAKPLFVVPRTVGGLETDGAGADVERAPCRMMRPLVLRLRQHDKAAALLPQSGHGAHRQGSTAWRLKWAQRTQAIAEGGPEWRNAAVIRIVRESFTLDSLAEFICKAPSHRAWDKSYGLRATKAMHTDRLWAHSLLIWILAPVKWEYDGSDELRILQVTNTSLDSPRRELELHE